VEQELLQEETLHEDAQLLQLELQLKQLWQLFFLNIPLRKHFFGLQQVTTTEQLLLQLEAQL
jgi:hypothetical protein